MTRLLSLIAICLLPMAAFAQTTLVDVGALKSKTAYDVAKLTPLAVSGEGKPAVILLDLAEGNVIPPHEAKAGFRLITVVSGTLYWGDGGEVDPAQETVYPAGSVLALPAKVDHWLAARDGDIRLQVVVLDDEKPVPSIVE